MSVIKKILNVFSGATEKTTPVDGDYVEFYDSAEPKIPKKVSWANIKATLKAYFDNIYATITQLLGKKNYHGVESYGTISFNNTSHVLTIASGTNTYWYKGTKYTTSSAITCDLDETADRDHASATLTTNTLYFIYFKDATGKLYWSPTAWNFKENVFVATVFWNGSAGSVMKEAHNHTRDLDWHLWAHDTIGTRYEAGLSLTNPTTVNDALLQIESGTIHDEDIDITISQQTTMRGWYKASANVYTFADYSLPYLGTSGQPQYLRTSDYTLQNVGSSDYVCYWVYATPNIDKPIYIIPTHATAAYNTLALARAETPPSLSGLNFNTEVKLIYRFIYKGDGNFQESADYRLTTPLPSGGVPSVTAGSVTFSPSGNIASTTVQTAIEELDTEKQATLVSGTNIKTINTNSILGSGDLTISASPTYTTLISLIDPQVNMSSVGSSYTDSSGNTYAETASQTRITMSNVRTQDIRMILSGKVSTGTGSFQLWNYTDSADLGTSTTTSTSTVVIAAKSSTNVATNLNDVITIRVKNSSAGGVTYIDGGGIVTGDAVQFINSVAAQNIIYPPSGSGGFYTNIKFAVLIQATNTTFTTQPAYYILYNGSNQAFTNIGNTFSNSDAGTVITRTPTFLVPVTGAASGIAMNTSAFANGVTSCLGYIGVGVEVKTLNI